MKIKTVIKKLCAVSFLVIFSINAMEVDSSKHLITLELKPWHKEPIKDGCDFYVISSALDGFCYETHKMSFLQHSKELRRLSKKYETTQYPLILHKKIGNLSGNETLRIVFRQKKNGELATVPLRRSIEKRLLRYLLHDVTKQERTSFDLCQKVVLKKCASHEHVNTYESLMRYIDFVIEPNFVPGDVVGFFKTTPLDGYGYSCTLQFDYYAVALGHNMYLSKLGNTLCVSDLQSLKNISCCSIAKINSAIGKREDFIQNPFRPIAFRNIIMKINREQEALCEFFCKDDTVVQLPLLGTSLLGFRCVNNQVELRSDSSCQAEVDGCRITTTESLFKLLLKGKINDYPLTLHRKLHYTLGDEVLSLAMSTKEGDITDIDLPFKIKRKLLAYLLHDNQDKKKQCFDFCKELCLKRYKNNQLISTKVSYDTQWLSVAENDLSCGDAIAMGSGRTIAHFVVALGMGMCISKLGNGGVIAVARLQAILDHYDCEGFVLLRPTITRYKKFWYDLNNNFKRTSMHFKNQA